MAAMTIPSRRRPERGAPGRAPVRPKNARKLAKNPGPRQAATRKLRSNWAPEQTSGWRRKSPILQDVALSGVTRDRPHPQPICSSPRGAQERRGRFAIFARQRTIRRSKRSGSRRRWTGTSQGDRLESASDRQRSKIGRRLAIGRAIDVRFKEQVYRHLGRTSDPLRELVGSKA